MTILTWPFFSTLAKAQRTIFIERSSGKTSASRDEMMRRLNTGDNLLLFPEGTSSDGTRVLPFRSALFGVAQLRRNDKPITVQSVAISYTRLDGIPLGRYWRPLFAWFGDLDLVPHLWQMVCLGETEAGRRDPAIEVAEVRNADPANQQILIRRHANGAVAVRARQVAEDAHLHAG